MRAAKCFFCYAWGDEKRYQKLELLRESIINESNENVSVILDRHDYEDNADFDELRSRIVSYDLVVVFCTPDFKEIVLDPDANKNKDREVLKEIRIITELFEKNGDSVFPVILEGNTDTALLELFSRRNARVIDTLGIIPTKNGKEYIVANSKKRDFQKFISRIISQTRYNSYVKSEEYKSTQEALDKLFGLTDKPDIPISCLVKPDLYSQIRNQRCYFVAGRKGSGKSTFINNYQKMAPEYFKEHYKRLVPLTAEDFQHENVYDMLFRRHRDDKTIVERHKLLCLFWEVYLILHCVVIIRAEIEDHSIAPTDERYPIFDRVTKKLMKSIGLDTTKKGYQTILSGNVPGAIFNAAAELIDDRFTTGMNEIEKGELLLTSFYAKFTVSAVIEQLFSRSDTKKFLDALSKCNRKILISLDGFDTHSEDFRATTERIDHETDDYKDRREYEELFFRTLLEVVKRFKDNKVNDKVADAFGRMMDFCIVLPKDRYDVIKETDRDSVKKQFSTLSWSGLELMELITRRLEYLITTIDKKYQVNTQSGIIERFNAALDFFPRLPTSITMNVNGNAQSMPLFNYILRSSFWRPRDVISNLSRIISLMVRNTEGSWTTSKESLTQHDIKLSMRSNAEKIIDEEFIREYKYVFRNLPEVLKSLQGLDEQIDVQRFDTIINGIKFDTSFSYDMSKKGNKIRILYQLGVIGLLFNKQIADHQHYLSTVCFEFNEGMAPLDDFLNSKFTKPTEVSIIFNPIFARRLMLNYNTEILIGNWDNEYFKSNHTNKESIHGM